MLLFALSIFLSAFLLFQVQPMIGKYILPWFGGTPAVWSTLMLAFQVLLTAGYAYATWLVQQVRRQALIHIVLLAAAETFIIVHVFINGSPIFPTFNVSTANAGSPVLEILFSLGASIAFPFFIIASNGPLMQAWFSRLYPTSSYARLYALSNVGSLLGLLTYPFWIEPNLTLRTQGWIWSIGFILFGLLSGWIALQTGRVPPRAQPVAGPARPSRSPARSLVALWIVLSATASLFLLSVTNQISQEVAVVPFLWILPLTIYLLSFILTFSGDRGYNRRLYVWLCIISIALTMFVMLNATSLHIYWQILAYSFLLFTSCMLCHGELYLLRPAAEHLTTFYLTVSIGGALGGIFVSLIAPLIFNGYWEFFLGLAMVIAILLTLPRLSHLHCNERSEAQVLRAVLSGVAPLAPRSRRMAKQSWQDLEITHLEDVSARIRFVFTVFALVTILLTALSIYFSEVSFSKRNFYGVIRVRQDLVGNPPQPAYLMSHGITVHGLQFLNDFKVPNVPTTYYVPESGAGLAILNHPGYGNNQRVGLLGLGVGTLVAYAQPGDVYRLYEINPVVVDLAAGVGDYFSFLSDSEADITAVVGDARISLQRELDRGDLQNFDVLVLDTFSSDSIPVHLVTKEAFALYLAHLAPDGIIAAHITNLHLDLQPVFWQLAQHYGLSIARIDYPGDSRGGYASHWILMSPDPAMLNIPAIQGHSVDLREYSTDLKLWTDDYSNLFQILK
jgi:hypothetical protein